MLREYKTPTIFGLPLPLPLPLQVARVQIDEESAAVARFAARVDALGPLSQASLASRARILEEVKVVARRIDGGAEMGVASGYGRRVLYEDPDRWSLAVIVLRPGQRTELHDHASWGCAVTVQGIERDRRFVPGATDEPVLSYERDYPAGTGYVFDPTDVHQPVGADPRQVTVALHFLVHDHAHHSVMPEIVELPQQYIELAA